MTGTPWFPRALLREQSHSWNLVGTVMSPGQNAQSIAPVVRSDGGGFWSCTMSNVSLSGIKGSNLVGRQRQMMATLLWRAIRQICDGGANSIIVPRNDALFRPYPAGVSAYGSIPHSDGSLFDDGSGYYQPVISVQSSGDAALRSTSLILSLTRCGDLVGGESFSIQHPTKGWRMYEIATVSPIDAGRSQVTFMPPLREAVPDGTDIEFDRPCCTMRLSQPNSMDLTVVPWTFNQADASFVEAP
jgi:hypothetical protein